MNLNKPKEFRQVFLHTLVSLILMSEISKLVYIYDYCVCIIYCHGCIFDEVNNGTFVNKDEQRLCSVKNTTK